MRIPFWYLVLAIRIRATMCIVDLINGEPAAVCYTCAFARRPDRCATREKCPMLALPTFNQMCPCALLTGAHTKIGGDPFAANDIDRISNTPFHGPIRVI